MSDIVERPFYVSVQHPTPPVCWPGDVEDHADCVVASTSGPKAVAPWLESRFPLRLKRVLHDRLHSAVEDGGDAEGAELAVRLRDIHSSNRRRSPRLMRQNPVDQLRPRLGRFHYQLIHAGSKRPLIDLRDLPDTFHGVGSATQHKLLQRLDLAVVVLPGRPEYPSSQIANAPVDLPPVDGSPLGTFLRSVYRANLHPTSPMVSVHHDGIGRFTKSASAAFRLGHGPIRRVMDSPCLSACRHSLLGLSCSRWVFGCPLRSAYCRDRQSPSGFPCSA
ncbi:hypothetical protein WSK_3623 [Novosphingobium sp. Rr 2-17]|nr:hypothetical protein WSK_3623 [Novosphingobium sp. Rr 2-17]